ncbi:hypothetical protein [Urechidicola vernalis]|uniref:Lipoprotein n=1 Tax=Urechidicola vernalis TaxID=3075600 RepID=A0ABU2Y3L1_9FLAO|nr:hypothetical protein [Urechidicola sp. P050]MDT0552239.1 hypothetical protein [Urechidicola sp. P050]
MKKIAILLVFVFAAAMITSCKSSKGCGLTGSLNTTPTTITYKA